MDNGVDLTDERSWTGHREGILDMRGTWAMEPVWHTVSQVKSNGMADVVTAWPALIAKQVLVKQVSSPVTDGALTAYQDAATGLWGFQDAGQTAVIPARYAVGNTEALDTPFPFQFKNGYAVVGPSSPAEACCTASSTRQATRSCPAPTTAWAWSVTASSTTARAARRATGM